MTYARALGLPLVVILVMLASCGGSGGGGGQPAAEDSNILVVTPTTPAPVTVVTPTTPAPISPTAIQLACVGKPSFCDPVVASQLRANMLTQFDDFINANPDPSWFYLPDDPTQMTAADKTNFMDPSVWPVEFQVRDDYPKETMEAIRRALNFIRYAIHTKAFAHILKERVLMDRGQIVDYREVLMAVRKMNQTFTIRVNTDSNVAAEAWYAGVGSGVVNGVRVPPGGSVPPNFDPLFGIGGRTNLEVTTSWNYVGAPSFDYAIPKGSNGLIDPTQEGSFSGLGNYTMGPSRLWFSPGIDYLTIQLLPHEMLHVAGYTHSDSSNLSAMAGWPKDSNARPVLDGVAWSDVNYGVGQLLTSLLGSYMFNNAIDFEAKYGLTSMNKSVLTALHNKVFDRDKATNGMDALGYNKGWYMTTQDLFFPMDYYGTPYVSYASTLVVKTDATQKQCHPLKNLFTTTEINDVLANRSPGETVAHADVARKLFDRAYTNDPSSPETHTKWDVYRKVKDPITGKDDREFFDWECTASQAKCYGRPKVVSSKKPDHGGQPFYFRTDAVWRYSSPKNSGTQTFTP